MLSAIVAPLLFNACALTNMWSLIPTAILAMWWWTPHPGSRRWLIHFESSALGSVWLLAGTISLVRWWNDHPEIETAWLATGGLLVIAAWLDRHPHRFFSRV